MPVFEITQEDEVEFETWLSEHDKTCPLKERSTQGAIGGRLTYSFTPTGIGLMKKISCACGKEINVGLKDL